MSTCNSRRRGWAARAAAIEWEAALAADSGDVGTSPMVPTFHDDSRRDRMASTLVRPESSPSALLVASSDDEGDDDRAVVV